MILYNYPIKDINNFLYNLNLAIIKYKTKNIIFIKYILNIIDLL